MSTNSVFQADRNVGHCAVCSGLKHARQACLACGRKDDAKTIMNAMNLHNQHQMDERREDSRRKSLVDMHPHKYMHMYADGMDSQKSEVTFLLFWKVYHHPSCVVQGSLPHHHPTASAVFGRQQGNQ